MDEVLPELTAFVECMAVALPPEAMAVVYALAEGRPAEDLVAYLGLAHRRTDGSPNRRSVATGLRRASVIRRLTSRTRDAAIESGRTWSGFTLLPACRPFAANIPDEALPAGGKALRVRRAVTADDQQKDEDTETLDWQSHNSPRRLRASVPLWLERGVPVPPAH